MADKLIVTCASPTRYPNTPNSLTHSCITGKMLATLYNKTSINCIIIVRDGGGL